MLNFSPFLEKTGLCSEIHSYFMGHEKKGLHLICAGPKWPSTLSRKKTTLIKSVQRKIGCLFLVTRQYWGEPRPKTRGGRKNGV